MSYPAFGTVSRSAFIESHLSLVHHIAKRFLAAARHRGIDYDDLFSTGCIGLIKAYDNFDDGRGCAFTTYAVPVISGEILRMFRHGNTVAVSRDVSYVSRQITRHGLEDESPEVISERCGCSVRTARRALDYSKMKFHSIDAPLRTSNGDLNLTEMIPVHADLSSIVMQDFFSCISEMERRIIRLRINGLTQSEIGSKIGHSQVHIFRILKRIQRKFIEYQEVI